MNNLWEFILVLPIFFILSASLTGYLWLFLGLLSTLTFGIFYAVHVVGVYNVWDCYSQEIYF